MHKYFIAIIILLISISCSKKKKIIITYNPFVGYTPLMYVKEMGWMKDEIDFVKVGSLGQSVEIFKSEFSDGFTGTQYEYEKISKNILSTVMLFNLSSGADKIHSSLKLDKILNSDDVIDVYLGFNSVNEVVLDAFLDKYQINANRINKIDIDQSLLSTVPVGNKPHLIISYEPYSTKLQKDGQGEIFSSKKCCLNISHGLFVKKSIFNKKKKVISSLIDKIKIASKELKERPKYFYSIVKNNLEGQSYNDFARTLTENYWVMSVDKKIISGLIEENKTSRLKLSKKMRGSICEK